MRWLALLGILGLLGCISVAVAEEPKAVSVFGPREGVKRIELPFGQYACRFEVNYEAEPSLPTSYVESHAWLVDEGTERWTEFASGSVKFVTVAEPVPPAEGVWAEWASQVQTAFSGLATWGLSATLTDATPLLHVSLSRPHRRAGVDWVFQCVEFAWPEVGWERG